jgi:hypothetical protein
MGQTRNIQNGVLEARTDQESQRLFAPNNSQVGFEIAQDMPDPSPFREPDPRATAVKQECKPACQRRQNYRSAATDGQFEPMRVVISPERKTESQQAA